MKKRYLFIVIFIVLTAVLLPFTAHAADDDFEVEYGFVPEIAGSQGGSMRLQLTVRNTGTTNITWVDVAINLETPYSKRWTRTIEPGRSRTVVFDDVVFSENDVNTQKILTVSINNNISANPDGIKIMRFTLTGTSGLYSISASVSPSRAEYKPGDTITVSYRIKNEMATSTLMHMTTRPILTGGRVILYSGESADLGNVFPGATKTNSFTYTFGSDYAGQVYLTCMQQFSFLEVDYAMGNSPLIIQAAGPEVKFTAALYADETEVNAGDNVTLRIAIGNTGSDAIGMFEVLKGGALAASAERLPAGGSGSVTLTERVYETTTFRYSVTGKTGSFTDTVQTNAVTVRVREPEAAGTAAAAPETSETPPAAEEPEMTAAPQQSAAASEPAQPASSGPGIFDMPYLLILIFALIILAGIAVIVILAVGRKKE